MWGLNKDWSDNRNESQINDDIRRKRSFRYLIRRFIRRKVKYAKWTRKW